MTLKYKKLNTRHLELLKHINVDANVEPDVIMDKVGDYLTLHCLDENYNPNEYGIICEEILDILADED